MLSGTGEAKTDSIKAVFVNSIVNVEIALLGIVILKVPFTVTLLAVLVVFSIEVI